MKRLTNLFIVLGATFFTLFLAELSARVLEKISPPPIQQQWREFRLSKPVPYKNASYDIAKILDEAHQVGWKTDPNYGYLPNDFSGDYINTKNGYRRTVPNPVSPERRVWFFGGSTVICFEVPDSLTVPSHFSRLANARFGGKLEIINAGATTVTIHHQLYRLRTSTNIRKGDVVIFMDGVNDIVQTLLLQNPTGNMIQHNREQLESAGSYTKTILYVYDNLGSYSTFVRRFLNPFKPKYLDVTISSDLLNTLENNYFASIMQANDYAKSKGASFYHFLQPNVYTVAKLTPYETDLLKNEYLNLKKFPEIFHDGYPRLRTASQKAGKLGVNTYDISTAFDKRQSEIFLDPVHVNEIGNELLATEILGLVKPAFEVVKRDK